MALDALTTGAQISEYASPCVFVEGIDAKPRTSQNEQDNRPLWSGHARVVALEPGTPDECYQLTRWAVELSALVASADQPESRRQIMLHIAKERIFVRRRVQNYPYFFTRFDALKIRPDPRGLTIARDPQALCAPLAS